VALPHLKRAGISGTRVMPGIEYLYTIARVAIALFGFSGVVAALLVPNNAFAVVPNSDAGGYAQWP